MRGDFWDIFDIGDDIAPGEPAVAEARRRAAQFESTWASQYPGAVACVTDGFDELVAHLHYPRAPLGMAKVDRVLGAFSGAWAELARHCVRARPRPP